MQTEERLHSLDAVRAFALLSGIFLHAAMTFMPGLAAFGFPADSSQSPTLQIAFYVIHIFRMTLFYFVAGYFAHLMFHRKGTRAFLKDRVKRIALPLVAGWIFFGPLAMVGVYMIFASKLQGPTPPPPAGVPLAHLWFLYYLLLCYGCVLIARAALVKLVDKNGAFRARIDGWMLTVASSFAAPIFFAAPIAACLYFTPNWMLWGGIASPDIGLTPRIPALFAFGTAFSAGWLAHRVPELLAAWSQRWSSNLVLAASFTGLSLWLLQYAPNPFAVPESIKATYAITYAIAIWSWVFGILGVAVRFFSSHNAARRYLADASYWMYLAHLPVVFGLQLLVLQWPVHWSLKFPLIVVCAAAILLGSYHLFVRTTWIGALLNGRRVGGNAAAPPVGKATAATSV